MSSKHPTEPVEPKGVPRERLDSKLPPDELPEESETERQARESEKAFDQAITRITPG